MTKNLATFLTAAGILFQLMGAGMATWGGVIRRIPKLRGRFSDFDPDTRTWNERSTIKALAKQGNQQRQQSQAAARDCRKVWAGLAMIYLGFAMQMIAAWSWISFSILLLSWAMLTTIHYVIRTIY